MTLYRACSPLVLAFLASGLRGSVFWTPNRSHVAYWYLMFNDVSPFEIVCFLIVEDKGILQ